MTTASTTPAGAIAVSSTGTQDWEPYVVETPGGPLEVGQVSWVSRHEGLKVGLWRITPEAGAELPYEVPGIEVIHVLDGEAVLEQPDGQSMRLTPGTVVTLGPGYSATWRTLTPFTKLFVEK